MTNFEKIKSFNDEELAMFLDAWETGDISVNCLDCIEGKCYECIKAWLNEEA